MGRVAKGKCSIGSIIMKSVVMGSVVKIGGAMPEVA